MQIRQNNYLIKKIVGSQEVPEEEYKSIIDDTKSMKHYVDDYQIGTHKSSRDLGLFV